MKQTQCILFALTASLTCSFVPSQALAERAWGISATRLGVIQQTSALVGKKVEDQKGKKLGTVADFLVDLPTGQVVLMLISAGDDLVPVPASTYAYLSGSHIVLSINRELFAAAPRVPKARPACALEPERRAATFRHFQSALPELAATQSDEFVSAVRFKSASLAGAGGEALGAVKELMVDVAEGRIVYLIVEPTAGPAPSSNLYLVPPVAVTASSHRLAVGMDRTKFLAGPHFQKEYWADLASPTLAAEVREYFGLAQAPAAVAVTPASAAGRSDREITQSIITELARAARGSSPVRVVVVTINGQVTLSGTVKNEQQRKLAREAAERAVGAANVVDHLETGRKNQTAKL